MIPTTPADPVLAEAYAAGQREVREGDRRQLIEAMRLHPGTPWGEIVEWCEAMAAQARFPDGRAAR